MKKILKTITLLLAALLAVPSARAAAADEAVRFGWFNASKAGMFITWGPYAVVGSEWKGQHGSRDAHLQNEFRIPMDEYGKLVKDFNPVKFDADAWVRLAKDAGFGYVVYVSKHHDGFAMFDSPSNPYNMVAATPFGRDPLKELAASCKAHGLVLCVYYSLGRDWAVPGVPRGGNRCNDWDFPKPPADAQKNYIQNKVKPQLRELLTQYGPIGAVWFDTPDQITNEHSAEIRDYIHSLQPCCLINARIGNGLGDFDIHEQKIPAAAIHRPWEACLTINQRWGYDRNDNQWKSPEMLVRCLVDVASKGGNFLINIGPTGEGVVPEPSVERLHALGDWMRVNSEAICGTTAAPIPVDGGGMVFSEINPDGSEKTLDAAGAAKTYEVGLPRGWRATAKPGIIYIHLFDRSENGLVSIKGLTGTVKRVTLLADPKRRALKFTQGAGGAFMATLPEDIWDSRATVLKLEMAGDQYSAKETAEKPLPVSGSAGNPTLQNSLDGTPPPNAVADPERCIPRLSPVPQSVNRCANPVLDLGGTWKFNPAPSADFQRAPGGQEAAAAGWADTKVPGEWAMQGFDVKPGTAAAYLRTFTLPKDWTGKRVKLRCDAVYSDATVFINGKPAGKHMGGFTPFEIDITGLLKTGGENVIALSVRNESPADTLASGTKYACHQLGGIPRRIRLLALPETNIASLQVTTSLDASYRNAMLTLSLELANEGGESAGPLEALLELRTPEGSPLPITPTNFPIESMKGSVTIPIENPLKWDNEHPRLHTLTITLLEKGKAVQTLSQRVGFRQVEVKGNQVLVNGSPVKLRGVNHHEVYPLTGRSVPDGLHLLDVGLFREGNVNLLRTCHYPPDDALLTAADELGMFVECEAPFCWAPGRGHTELVCRMTAEMVLACRNHPSVLFWSIANESKWGDDFMASSRLARKLDPTRPQTFNWMKSGIQTVEEGFTDIANIHYPAHGGPAQIRKYTKRPVYLGEDCHLNAYNRLELATDPALRDLWGRYTREMWDDLYETDGSLGQSIWAGIDDTFYMKDDRTVGYGTWGPLDGWRRTKPEYWGMKKAYSPIRLDEKSGFKTNPDGGIEIPVVNRNNFSNLGEMKIDWRLGAKSGSVKVDIAPRSTGTIRIKPEHKPDPADQLELTFTDPRGFVADQFLLAAASDEGPAGAGKTYTTPCILKESETTLTVTSGQHQWSIDKKSGLLASANKLTVSGPELLLLPMNKDGETQMTGKTKVWEPFTAPCSGWTCTKVASSLENGTVTIFVEGRYDNAGGGYRYTFAPGGGISIAYNFTLTKDVNPRQVGLVFGLPRECETLSWERNGYWNVYPEDHIARLKGTVRASEGFDATSVGPRTKPVHPWRLDNLPYGNNDFCSTKHNILVATVSDGNDNGLMIEGAGRQHVRCWKKANNVFFLVADYSNGGSERFLRGHSGKDDRPLKAGDKAAGSVTLGIPEPRKKCHESQLPIPPLSPPIKLLHPYEN